MTREQQRAYWRHTLRTVAVLLAIWFAVSFLAGIVLADPLDRLWIGGFPLRLLVRQPGLGARLRPAGLHLREADEPPRPGVRRVRAVGAERRREGTWASSVGRGSSSARRSPCTWRRPSGGGRVRPPTSTWPIGAVHPVLNGMATGAEWMSAASFMSMAGLVAFDGPRRLRLPHGLDGRVRAARGPARAVPAQVREVHGPAVHRGPVLLAGRPGGGAALRGPGLVHLRRRARCAAWGSSSRASSTPPSGTACWSAWWWCSCTRCLGGMKGITYAQVAQYAMLIVAYLVPAGLVSRVADREPRSRSSASGRPWARGGPALLGAREPGQHLLGRARPAQRRPRLPRRTRPARRRASTWS